MTPQYQLDQGEQSDYTEATSDTDNTANAVPTPEELTFTEAAARAGVAMSTVYKRAKEGTLPTHVGFKGNELNPQRLVYASDLGVFTKTRGRGGEPKSFAPIDNDDLISCADAAKLKGVSEGTIRLRYQRGGLPGQKIQVGKRELLYVSKSVLDELRFNKTSHKQHRPDIAVRNQLKVELGRMPNREEVWDEMERRGMKVKRRSDLPVRTKTALAKRKGHPPMITQNTIDQAFTRARTVTTQATATNLNRRLLDLADMISSGLFEVTRFEIELRTVIDE